MSTASSIPNDRAATTGLAKVYREHLEERLRKNAPIHRPTGSSSLIWMFVGKYRQAHAGTTGDPDPAPTDYRLRWAPATGDYRLRWAPATGDFLSYKDADGES